MHEEIFRIPFDYPLFLHCCPWWLLETEGVIEVAGYSFDSSNGNLGSYFIGGNIPCALRNAIRSFDNGYQKGLTERSKRESKNGRRDDNSASTF